MSANWKELMEARQKAVEAKRKVLGAEALAKSSVRPNLILPLATESAKGAYCTGGESKGPLPHIHLNDMPPPPPEVSEAPAKKAKVVDLTEDSPRLTFPVDAASKTAFLKVSNAAGVGGEGAPPGGSVVNLEARVTHQIMPNQMIITNDAEWETKTLNPILSSVGASLGTEKLKAHLYKLLLYTPGSFFKSHRDTTRIPGMIGTLVIALPSTFTGAILDVRSPLTPDTGTSFDTSLAPSEKPIIKYVAFYNDCLHSVSELTAGDRVVLIYSLVAKGSVPPQPAPVSVADAVATAISGWKASDPAKHVIVLKHKYTKNSLKSIRSLKGTDRAVAELILAARHRARRPFDGEYETVSQPQFDAYLTLIHFWHSDVQPEHDYHTVGQLVPLLPGSTARHPLSLDPPTKPGDYAPYVCHEGDFWPNHAGATLTGNHSLIIEQAEFLLEDERTRRYCSDGTNEPYCHRPSRPQDVEFLGNGGPPMGEVYSRAALLVWPISNRAKVSAQAAGVTSNPFHGMGDPAYLDY